MARTFEEKKSNENIYHHFNQRNALQNFKEHSCQDKESNDCSFNNCVIEENQEIDHQPNGDFRHFRSQWKTNANRVSFEDEQDSLEIDVRLDNKHRRSLRNDDFLQRVNILKKKLHIIDDYKVNTEIYEKSKHLIDVDSLEAQTRKSPCVTPHYGEILENGNRINERQKFEIKPPFNSNHPNNGKEAENKTTDIHINVTDEAVNYSTRDYRDANGFNDLSYANHEISKQNLETVTVVIENTRTPISTHSNLARNYFTENKFDPDSIDGNQFVNNFGSIEFVPNDSNTQSYKQDVKLPSDNEPEKVEVIQIENVENELNDDKHRDTESTSNDNQSTEQMDSQAISQINSLNNDSHIYEPMTETNEPNKEESNTASPTSETLERPTEKIPESFVKFKAKRFLQKKLSMKENEILQVLKEVKEKDAKDRKQNKASSYDLSPPESTSGQSSTHSLIESSTPGRENWRLRESDQSRSSNSTLQQFSVLVGQAGSETHFLDYESHKYPSLSKANRMEISPDIVRPTGALSGDNVSENDSLDSLDFNEVYSSEQNERDSLNASLPPHISDMPHGGGKGRRGGNGGGSKLKNGRSILGFLHSRNAGLLEQKEPFSYFWVLLSTLYGKVLIVLMIAFCLVEVMDNSIKLLTLQGFYLIYLYIGSISVIICIYIWVLVDSCSSWNSMDSPNITTSVMADAELGSMTLSRFDSLKRAHISRAKTSATSFYIRIGALAFGLGTLVFNGLEMAMHSLMEGACLNGVVFVHPVLHGLFTFLQMHFLFVNSQVLVEKFGPIARFGFMHLAATNLALWIRLVIWESGVEWVYFVHLAQSASGQGRSLSPLVGGGDSIPTPLHLRGYPKFITDSAGSAEAMAQRSGRGLDFATNATWSGYVYRPISDGHIAQVVNLHQCLNTNSLGQLWTSSMPFLYPFIVQFSLIAAGVTYVMGKNVGLDRIKSFRYVNSINKKHQRPSDASNNNNNNNHHKSVKSTYSYDVDAIDCSSASKGLFLGLLCLVIVIVIVIIFLVVKEDPDFPVEILFWMTSGTLSGILVVSLISSIIGLYQVRKLSHTGYAPTQVDKLFSSVTLTGVIFYSIFGIVIGSCGLFITLSSGSAPNANSYDIQIHAMLIFVNTVQLLQTGFQSTLLGEALRRGSITTHQILTKPGRQVITFLLCSNGALWAFDSFITQSWLSQELQLRFMGLLAWGVISRISLPLLVFYRFHSGVLLLEIWQRTYRSFRFDHHSLGN